MSVRPRPIVLALVLALAALGAGCSSDSEGATPDAGADPTTAETSAPAGAGDTAPDAGGEAGPVAAAFADGSSLTIDAPAGATAEQFQDGVEVVAGTSFQLEIYPGVGSTSEYKAELEANDLNTVTRYLVDEPDELLWESEVGGTAEFHLYAIIGEGDGYTCFDTRGPVYTEAEATAMLEACTSAQAS